MLRDVEFLKSRISKLDGAADIGDRLLKIVNDKAIVEKIGPADDTLNGVDSVAEKEAPAAEDQKT